MSEDELAAIEAHAQAVDSRMSENCLRLIAALTASRAGRALAERRLQKVIAERDALQGLAKRLFDPWDIDHHIQEELSKEFLFLEEVRVKNEWDL